MPYEVTFLEIAGAQDKTDPNVSVIFRFEVFNGLEKTHADVALTQRGLEIIEKGGKDPTSAARIVLDRLLRSGRDPFESHIFLQVPYGHAAYFSKNGNYNALPVLSD